MNEKNLLKLLGIKYQMETRFPILFVFEIDSLLKLFEVKLMAFLN